ncbi:MAG: hypothetical protein AAGL69_16265 [Pseudomonadota bacterium]
MSRLRTIVSQIAAFSVIATQLLCGCAGASDVMPVIVDSPAAMSASSLHHEGERTERPPCHGQADSAAEGPGGAPDDAHDCTHCASSLAMAGHGELPVLLATVTTELPDLGAEPEPVRSSVIPRTHLFDSGPPAVAASLPAETLVSLKLLLLI